MRHCVAVSLTAWFLVPLLLAISACHTATTDVTLPDHDATASPSGARPGRSVTTLGQATRALRTVAGGAARSSQLDATSTKTSGASM
jgi:hypothetical protein